MDEWIDINERKPEHYQHVLISAGDVVASVIADTERYKDGRIYWWCRGNEGPPVEWEFSDKDVTHWMPTPEPAKVIDKEADFKAGFDSVRDSLRKPD